MRTLLHNLAVLLLVTQLGYAAEDFSITVNNVGIGNSWRAGDITPINITVASNKPEPIAAWIQWEVPDADGDMVLWGRAITLAPMSETSTWLYAPTRGWDKPDTAWTVRLKQFEDDTPTKELQVLRFSPQSVGALQIGARIESYAVVGTRRLGLEHYLPTLPEVKQEAAMIVSGLSSNELPDAWPCYQSLDALIWADASPDISFRQTEAIQNWVSRGGHFILSLPTIGDPWALGSQKGPLESLLSGVRTEITQVPIQSLENILGRNNTLSQNNWPKMDVSVRVFGTVHAPWDEDIVPLIWLEDGSVIAIQKTVGFGSVTMVGIDLTSGQLASLRLPHADVLWNRIFGKRNDTPSQLTIQQLKDADKFSPTLHKITTLSTGKIIAQEIAMSTTASGKLGIVFLLVLSYWIIGGPAGYYILSRKRKLQWSWVLFATSAVVFSIGAWIIAASTSGVPIPLKHVSIIDHVYGGNGQRVTGWFSLFLPNFGKTKVSLEGDADNLLLPWTPPDASMTPDFIDRREVVVHVDHVPHTFDQPARATTANFSFNWMGIVEDSFYKSLLRIAPEDAPMVEDGGNPPHPLQLIGSIKNNTSTALHDVSIIWVTAEQVATPTFDVDNADNFPVTWVAPSQSGQILNKMYAWRVPSWESGTYLNLNELHANNTTTFTNAVDNRYRFEDEFRVNTLTPKEWRTKIEMLSLYSHLTPPVYQKNSGSKQGPESYRAIREGGRVLDFAEWFSRPCLIVMGFIPNAPLPVSITSDGEEIKQSKGVTLVRWVYPLEQVQ